MGVKILIKPITKYNNEVVERYIKESKAFGCRRQT